jgi:ribonucleotide reductase beta subunit family protein with ferritin-like domain
LVTPNHRVVYYDTKGRFKESVASELSVKRNIKIPEAGKLINDGLTALSYVERLRLALQADGNRRYYDSGYGKKLRKGDGIGAEYELRVKEPHKVTRMDWLIENLQDNPTIRITKAPIPSRPGFFCYTVRIDDEFDYKRFDWVNLYNKNYKWCLDFVDELREWDGSRPPGGKDCLHRFSSTVKDVSDKAQMVGVAAGFRTNLTVKPDDREESYLDNHYVSFTSNRERTSISSLKKESVEYEGKVWCVTVESGLVVTRYHGKTYVSGNSEIRHADAYSHILELLDLNDQFDIILQNPAIEGRVKYLSKYLAGAGDNSNQSFALTLAMFALLVESVSLFAQFLVIKSFDKKLHVLKGLDNTIQSTIREEQIHSLFGVKLLEIIKEENPDWFTEDNFYQKLYRASKKAYEAEEKIIEWIFEAGELDFLPMHVVKEFTKDRINKSLIMIGGNPVFEVDQTAMAEVLWFNEELLAEVNTDFFHKRPVAYSKFMQSYQAEDLF